MNILKLKEQVNHVEKMLFIYGNELCDSVRLKELETQLKELNAQILEIMSNNTNLN